MINYFISIFIFLSLLYFARVKSKVVTNFLLFVVGVILVLLAGLRPKFADLDYCFRLNKLFGLRVIVFASVHMMHSIGYPIKTFLGFSASAYSAFRTYYVVKNQILILRRYPRYYSLKEIFDVFNNYIIMRIFTIFFYEKSKKQKFAALLKGVKEGFWQDKEN